MWTTLFIFLIIIEVLVTLFMVKAFFKKKKADVKFFLNAFHYLNDYQSMPIKNIRIDNNRLISKDFNKKLHSCITLYEELSQLSMYLYKLYEEKRSLMEFDYFFDNIDQIVSYVGYMIIKK